MEDNMAKQNQKPVYEEQPSAAPSPVLKVMGALVCFGLAVLMVYLAAAQPQTGTFMASIRNVMRGIGGAINPLLALVMVWIGVLMVFSARGKRVRVINVIMNAILFLCGFTVVQLFFARTIIQNHMSITTFANFVSRSYQLGYGGGALGALCAYPLYISIGQWGGLIVLLLAALICLVATGKAQKFYNWAVRRAEEGQHHMEQRRNVKNVERMFDYNRNDYEPDEYDGFDAPQRPIRRKPQPQSRPAPRPAERPRPRPQPEREKDYIVIGDPIPEAKTEKQPRKPASSRSKKLYKENLDPEAAQVQDETIEQPGMDIPKPLREIRKTRVVTPDENEKPRKSRSKFPRDIPDYFNVQEEAPETVPQDDAEPEVQKEDNTFRPDNYVSRAPRPKRVVEGVQPLTVDGVVSEQEPEEDDDTPFDIPHIAEKASKFSRRKPEPEPEEEEDAYNYPPIDLLEQSEQTRNPNAHKDQDREKADKLIETLHSFGIESRLLGIAHGPAVTRFELQPAPGVKVSRITALADDIALNLAALSVRIEAPIPGKAAVGVEIPNDKIEMVRLRDVLESPDARRHPSKIAVGLGKDNSGRYIVGDIAKMPHVLIAGQTGSGKSVCINSIITSILYRATPDEVRMILIDPKMVELSIYNDIPHLIAPVVTDPKKAASALEWAVAEMTTRYKRFAERGVRDIKGYNKALEPGEKIMPQMVIVIDELADLMMVAPGEVEDSICRLAQLARAAGMHLVIATQRPSVNVITGVIKVNIPTRIAFSVASQVDSRTMIDHSGAEKLLGNGDMLFVPPGTSKPIRVQGAWVSDEEVHSIVSYIKARSETSYDEDVIERIENSVRSDAEKEEVASEYDPKLAEAVEIVVEAGQASVSMLQRRMRVGYARAGRLIDEMERRGIVSEADGAKPRNVLISREQFMNMFEDEEY